MSVGPQWSYIPSPTIPVVKKYYFLIDTQKEASNFMWHTLHSWAQMTKCSIFFILDYTLSISSDSYGMSLKYCATRFSTCAKFSTL